MAELNFNPNEGLVGSFVDTEDLRKSLDEHKTILDDLRTDLRRIDDAISQNPENKAELEDMRARCLEQIEKSDKMAESTTMFLQEYEAANAAVMSTISKLTVV